MFISASELAHSVQTKSCLECQLLSDVISTRHEDWTLHAEQWPSIRLGLAVGKPAQLNYRTQDRTDVFDLQIYRSASQQAVEWDVDLPKAIGLGPDIPPFSGSEESISLIKKWYAECSAEHELCNSYFSGDRPTRLLDTRGENPALIEASTADKAGYVALSYCWGTPDKHPMLRTTKSTISQRQAGIEFASLPAVFRDAIVLARALGFIYIWIDALCIIQDDADDWTKEAATMCRVYSQASLTIIASRSDGCTTSIFGDQAFAQFDVVSFKGVSLRVRTNISKSHEINPVIPLGPDADPISRRAWTLQEGVLSNRAVYFTSDELRWECNTWRRCQCGQLKTKFPLKYDAEEYEYEGHRTWRLNDFFPTHSVEEAYRIMWQNMVVFYTNRSLTMEQDRLVALSGLAQRFDALMKERFQRKDTYLAGIWQGALPAQLLWCIVNKAHSTTLGYEHTRPSAWRAPSWSWASMEAPVFTFLHTSIDSRLEVMEALVEPKSEDHFGQVKLAILRVRAPVLHDVRFIRDPERVGWSRFPVVKFHNLDLRIENAFFDNDLEAETDKYLNDPKQRFSLLVVGYGKGNDLHECLAITPVSGKIATFERIGLIRLGQHFREPEGNARAIENASCEEVILV
ncbi:uncharacterized protein Z519_11881 [Cladophialophora bantiana CBS 173.52]|uniref:Heterokaryon incompatibility domain-containing protein n=1 Tax=Cladophialophora bantiana (strain ATCC 10958 / CBS 173.52 / CDC B-1940 / NIH 8579) TaxID=1442370 RepID=A0A0D2FLJ6_CLAB1|nr:uncharacterized protein Z519_11881 [Cladophialophora bantiana CBS 173.52]KIW87557.1 hypothetical protein Z519_11881 [Cladophialophora bantiana CBS 173.52]